jgi:mannonate dehydratase
MIKIGTRISPDWLERPDDLAFLKQIGIEYVDITLDMVDGYKETGGRIEKDALEKVMEDLDGHGLTIERANFLSSELMPVYLGDKSTPQILENAEHTSDVLGAAGIPLLGVQIFSAAQMLAGGQAGEYSWREGRGDYQYLHIDVREAIKEYPPPEGAPTHDELWERLISIYKAVTPIAETHGMNVAMHGNDPPVPSVYGIPQILYNQAAYDRLFREVPNPNNGVTFCVGTRYESGEDIFKMIKDFGEAKRLFHVHFRNVLGTIPANGEYSEVAPDEGDLNMADVARALHEVDYDGVIDYDHVMRLINDPEGKRYIAYCVGYMRGILNSIQGPKTA